eukprot:1516774-Prymnesium_polylepis.1
MERMAEKEVERLGSGEEGSDVTDEEDDMDDDEPSSEEESKDEDQDEHLAGSSMVDSNMHPLAR